MTTPLNIFPVTTATWEEFEALFEMPGSPKYCWCTAWRHLADRRSATSADRKAMMAGLVTDGIPVGLIAKAGDDPAGWCSLAPRETLRKLSPQQENGERGVWSIVCFFVRRPYRRKGVAGALLDAAVEHAFENGARTVEAYPVDPDSPSYRFMGFRQMFRARGFRETGMAGSRRHVMRLDGR